MRQLQRHERPVAVRGRRCSGVLLALGLVWVGAADAPADEVLYRYVDADGVIHFTNAPVDDRFEPVSSQTPMGPAMRGRRGLDGVIERAAARQALPAALVKAVIAAESNFDPRAVSHKGAMGLMQLMPATARELGVRHPFRPEDNVSGGSRYLRSMLNRYGRVELALAAYNAGPKAVERYGGIPPYSETREYVRRVMGYYRKYDADFGTAARR